MTPVVRRCAGSTTTVELRLCRADLLCGLARYETEDEQRALLNLALKDTMERFHEQDPSQADQLEQFVAQHQAGLERFIRRLRRRLLEASELVP